MSGEYQCVFLPESGVGQHTWLSWWQPSLSILQPQLLDSDMHPFSKLQMQMVLVDKRRKNVINLAALAKTRYVFHTACCYPLTPLGGTKVSEARQNQQRIFISVVTLLTKQNLLYQFPLFDMVDN